jgi:hypothetical protein
VQHTTPQRSTGDKILGTIAYSVEKTKTGMWVLFIEELIGTRRSRGRGLRMGRKLIREAIREALSHGGVEEIHLVVRNASQQVHAHDIYRELGISRQKQNATKNRVRINKLTREEQYWVGKVDAATNSLGAEQEENRPGGETTTRYNGLEETTAREKAEIRSEFEEVHTHRNGDKATWAEHGKTSIHVVIREAEWEQQTETPIEKEMERDVTYTLGGVEPKTRGRSIQGGQATNAQHRCRRRSNGGHGRPGTREITGGGNRRDYTRGTRRGGRREPEEGRQNAHKQDERERNDSMCKRSRVYAHSDGARERRQEDIQVRAVYEALHAAEPIYSGRRKTEKPEVGQGEGPGTTRRREDKVERSKASQGGRHQDGIPQRK